ncbi:hypothetical protein [Anaerovorax odorimutans]|uniref:hypothetical protein n=1 Tax=Anaerovorax odorimutans TaxID=109327 RepID=UPI0004069318|nr:hypothetical protein [Anaerovorax odorimutans]
MDYNITGLGQNIIVSATQFETAVASILYTQANYLDTLIERNESTQILMEANEQICCLVCGIKCIEVNIVDNIEEGIKIRPQYRYPQYNYPHYRVQF